jgi:hypothetical protein
MYQHFFRYLNFCLKIRRLRQSPLVKKIRYFYEAKVYRLFFHCGENSKTVKMAKVENFAIFAFLAKVDGENGVDIPRLCSEWGW